MYVNLVRLLFYLNRVAVLMIIVVCTNSYINMIEITVIMAIKNVFYFKILDTFKILHSKVTAVNVSLVIKLNHNLRKFTFFELKKKLVFIKSNGFA